MRVDQLIRWGFLVCAALLWSVVTLRRPSRAPAPPVRRPVPSPERLRAAGLLSAALVVLLAVAAPLRAQDEPTSPQVVVPPGTVVSTGTVAHYDPAGRRDPFEPLYAAAADPSGGPRFEALKLTGVFLGTGNNSLAVLEDPSHRGYFVRLGQQIGNARLVEMLPQAAVFEVSDYGASRRVVLRLERTEERR